MSSTRLVFVLSLLVSTAWLCGAQSPDDAPSALHGRGQCVSCHAGLGTTPLGMPARLTASDVHARAGVGCAACHGGNPNAYDPVEAHSPAHGFVAVPDARDLVEMCAKCHSDPVYMRGENPALPTDQLEKYWTSKHGELLQMGLRKVANCVSCHTAHDIRPANDPLSSVYPVNLPGTCAKCHADQDYMRGFPIPTDQHAKYAASVHGRALLEREDLGAPACNDCHGNHGAFPPEAESLAHVCGTCHSVNTEFYEQSPHAEIFALQGHPQCVTCHGYHAIPEPDMSVLAMAAGSPCIECHNKDDAGWNAGLAMHEHYEQMTREREQAEALLTEAQRLGMDISDGRFHLQDFRKTFLQMRTVSHSLDMEAFGEMAAEAIAHAQEARLVAEKAIGEFHYRRKGLAVALLLSLPVAILMWLKIRSLGLPEPQG